MVREKREKLVNTTKGKNMEILCNACGRKLKINPHGIIEDAFAGTKEWGFFSRHDMEIHHFVLCEECYETMIHQFKIPVQITEKTEAL